MGIVAHEAPENLYKGNSLFWPYDDRVFEFLEKTCFFDTLNETDFGLAFLSVRDLMKLAVIIDNSLLKKMALDYRWQKHYDLEDDVTFIVW